MAAEQVALQISAPGSLTAFRYANYDTPFWVRPNSRDGRWHRRGDPPTQYWALCPEAAWAELIRAENLLSEGDLDLVRMPLWVCRLPRVGLVDLRDSAMQEHYGITPEEIADDDYSSCQRAAQQLREDGRGVLSESAALPGHVNLTIFGRRRMVDWHSRPALASTVPATRVAIGRPPQGLLALVRRRQDDDSQTQLF